MNWQISSDSSSSSSDEEDVNFIERLNRPRKERIYRNRTDNFIIWDDIEFYHRFRLSKRIVNILLNLIRNDIKSETDRNHAVTPNQMILLTIRFLASGGMLISVGDFIGIHKSTAGKYIWKVLQAIANLRPQFIKFPNTPNEIKEIQAAFFSIARFPKVVGTLDGTHVRIQSPGGDNAETYRNRKQFFSVNVQAICGANLQFFDVVARWPGSAHDSRIFQNSRIKARFQNNEFPNAILLADSGYAITKYCITPLQNAETEAETLFNESQIRTRNVIERCFGVWKRRFPILALGIRLKVIKTQCLIIATAILHNLAVMENEREPPPLEDELEEAVIYVNSVPQHIHQPNRQSIIRNPYIRYFQNLVR